MSNPISRDKFPERTDPRSGLESHLFYLIPWTPKHLESEEAPSPGPTRLITAHSDTYHDLIMLQAPGSTLDGKFETFGNQWGLLEQTITDVYITTTKAFYKHVAERRKEQNEDFKRKTEKVDFSPDTYIELAKELEKELRTIDEIGKKAKSLSDIEASVRKQGYTGEINSYEQLIKLVRTSKDVLILAKIAAYRKAGDYINAQKALNLYASDYEGTETVEVRTG